MEAIIRSRLGHDGVAGSNGSLQEQKWNVITSRFAECFALRFPRRLQKAPSLQNLRFLWWNK
jgi:hypothetical protein